MVFDVHANGGKIGTYTGEKPSVGDKVSVEVDGEDYPEVKVTGLKDPNIIVVSDPRPMPMVFS